MNLIIRYLLLSGVLLAAFGTYTLFIDRSAFKRGLAKGNEITRQGNKMRANWARKHDRKTIKQEGELKRELDEIDNKYR